MTAELLIYAVLFQRFLYDLHIQLYIYTIRVHSHLLIPFNSCELFLK